MSDIGQAKDSSTYIHDGMDIPSSEFERLDAMTTGINAYLGGITLAPLPDHPKKILDIGCGSGAWAIDAARKFPDAEVLAVDVSPMPKRSIPSNMLFQQLNILTDPMLLETNAFDVIHLRYTLLHLPNGQTVLPRLASLVAPHGYLLIDEWTIRDLDVNEETSDMQLANVPGIKRCIVTWAGFMRSRGGDPSIGPKLKSWLDEMSEFETVEVDEVKTPLHPLPIDPRLRAVSETIFASLSQAFTGPTSEALQKYGYTDELKQGWLDEVGRKDLEWKYTVALHFVWARKGAGGGV